MHARMHMCTHAHTHTSVSVSQDKGETPMDDTKNPEEIGDEKV